MAAAILMKLAGNKTIGGVNEEAFTKIPMQVAREV